MKGLTEPGKGTNVELLEKALIELGYPVITYSFPQYESTVGKVIAEYLRGDYGSIENLSPKLLCVAYAADRARYAEDIFSYLENGYIVLCDRYTYSNMFNLAKMPKENWEQFIDWLEDLEFDCLGVVKPDYNIYLKVDPEISIEKIKSRGKREYQNEKEDIHESNFNLLKTANEAYLHFAEKRKDWIIIDEMEDGKQLPLERVFAKLFSQVYDKIK